MILLKEAVPSLARCAISSDTRHIALECNDSIKIKKRLLHQLGVSVTVSKDSEPVMQVALLESTESKVVENVLHSPPGACWISGTAFHLKEETWNHGFEIRSGTVAAAVPRFLEAGGASVAGLSWPG